MIIVVEGVDGSGKSTVADGVAKHFDALRLDFPYEAGSPTGRAGRLFLQRKWFPHWDEIDFPTDAEYDEVERLGGLPPIVLLSLLTINKYEQLDLLRRHAGAHNPRHLVLARYIPSALVYGTLDGLDRQWLEAIHAGLPPADINLLVNVDTDMALGRIEGRGDLREHYENRLKVRAATHSYFSLWMERKDSDRYRWRVVTGVLPVEQVVKTAIRCVKELLSDAC